MASQDELGISLQFEPDFKSVFADLPPAIARHLRAQLRASGDEIIADQKKELDKPLPARIRKTGKKLYLITPRDGRKPYMAYRVLTSEVGAGGNQTRGMRQAIKGGLATRVVTSGRASRQGVNIRTSKSKAPMSVIWQSKQFRHPVFGDSSLGSFKGGWAYQQGQPYFWDPVIRGYVKVQKRVADAIDQALSEAAKRQ